MSQAFSPFLTMFSIGFFPRGIKVSIVWSRSNSNIALNLDILAYGESVDPDQTLKNVHSGFEIQL